MCRFSLLLRLVLLIELCAAQNDCGRTKKACVSAGGDCQLLTEYCSGEILEGRQYCQKWNACGCCIPAKDAVNQCLKDGEEDSVLFRKIVLAHRAINDESSKLCDKIDSAKTSITGTLDSRIHTVEEKLDIIIHKLHLECEPPWVKLGIYGCYQVIMTGLKWDESLLLCENMGARLAILDTWFKQKAMYEHLVSIGRRMWGFWLGANNRPGVWDWMWINGKLVGSIDWLPGQPGPEADQCMYTYDYGLGGYDCTTKNYIICEKPNCCD